MENSDKPSWEDAPEWARFIAFNGDRGVWKWYEYEPTIDNFGDWKSVAGKFVCCHEYVAAKNSLEKRPGA